MRASRNIPPSELLQRRRPVAPYAGLLLGTIALGLATRRYPTAFPALVATYGGDALWAAMVLWLLALVRPAATTPRLAMGALAVAYAVEVSQLYRAEWIDAVRATRVGALALGQGFLVSDLVSYAIGVALAAGLDAMLVRHGRGAGHSADPSVDFPR
jgi:hypothetical protein